MKNCTLLGRLFMAALLAWLLSGCAAPEAVRTERYFWPPLPDRPRIEWLHVYSSQLDLPKTAFRRLKEEVVGEDRPIEFKSPLDIKSDGEGRVYVTDPAVPVVFVYDLKGLEVRAITGREQGPLLQEPLTLALDGAGAVYVVDRRLKGVVVYDRGEKYLRTIKVSPHIKRMSALAVDRKNGRLLITDTGAHKVGVFTLEGQFLFAFGSSGGGDGEFNFPVAVTLNRAGEIIVADAMNARIQVFNEEGRFLRKFGRRGDAIGDFQMIKSVAVDSDGNIYVTDGKAHRLLIFNARGEFLLSLGGYYSTAGTGKAVPGGFVFPQGIDIDRNDTIYVVDQMNRRFQVFQYLSDGYLKANPIPEMEKTRGAPQR